MHKSRIESRQQMMGFNYGIRRRPYRSFGGASWGLCARREGWVVKRRYFSDVRYGTPGRTRGAVVAFRERRLMIEFTSEAAPPPVVEFRGPLATPRRKKSS
ncbi:hypothetical protein [Lysobacter sp. Root559]|uniref:hypothetical protein n=1 Tax=Lysobacter sp. Root559 TaxID=1736559 RepID=UPI0012F9DE13|nr:hypothetical protein [Lysobacter sp. Root559]